MAAVRSVNTKPELHVRKGLHAAGLRFRLHVKDMPGKPDLVFARRRAVVFVNGCFWHGHDCHLFKWPGTRSEFWHEKIGRNVAKDAQAIATLRASGWRVAIVWECALKGRTRLNESDTIRRLAAWLRSDSNSITIQGN